MTAIDNLRVLADWNRDKAYSHPLSDITGRVISADWAYGFNAPGQLITPPAQGTVVLDNADGAFSPDKPGAAYAGLLRPGITLRFQHTAGLGVSPAYISVLRIVDIQVVPGSMGGRTVVLTLADWHDDLMNALYDPKPRLTQKTGSAIVTALDTGLVPLPHAGSYWVLDASVLDVDTYPLGAASAIYDVGQSLLPYVGNNIDQGQGTNLYSFIQEMCAAEMSGRFWLATSVTTGNLIWRYLGRTGLANNYDPDNTLSIPASRFIDPGSDYEYAQTLCNSLEITMYPRSTGAAGTEIASITSPFRLRAGESRELTLRYRDPDYPDGTCAAKTIITPVSSTDYTANIEQDGSGADVTSSLGVGIEDRTNAAYVRLTNNSAADMYVTMFKVRGTPLTARQPVTVKSVDGPSLHEYGYHRQTLTVAGVDDQELVQRFADQYVQSNKDPIARYRRVSFIFPDDANDVLYTAAFTLPLQAKALISGLRIVDDWIEDVSGTRIHWVAGVQHSVNAVTRTWQTTWFLEDYIQQSFWKLDDPDLSILDVSTRPAF